jgi:hypothetical protein
MDCYHDLMSGTRLWESSEKRPFTIFASNMVRPPPKALILLIFKQLVQDLIIAEDDPYFFLQIGEYVPKSKRKAEYDPAEGEDVARFVGSLVPTYLRIDTQGRVIRMDTFSKVRHSVPPTPLCQPLF